MSDIIYLVGLPHKLSKDGTCYEVIKDSEEYKRYKQGYFHQISEWLKGNPIHNNWHENPDYGECTPCMSCCLGIDYLWPEDIRREFIEGNDELRSKMLMMSLSTLVKDQDVYVAGSIETREN